MGTLDDAILERLELKKRSGASEEEVRRLESEAFGPTGRGEPGTPAGETSPPPDPDDPDGTTERRDYDLPPDVEDPAPTPPPEPSPPDDPPPAARASSSWLEDEERRPQDTSEFT